MIRARSVLPRLRDELLDALLLVALPVAGWRPAHVTERAWVEAEDLRDPFLAFFHPHLLLFEAGLDW